jgi:hypothetical protein
MKRKYALLSVVIASLFAASTLWGQGSYKAVKGGPPGAAIPSGVQAVLESQSVEFENSQGAPVCEIWWRKGIPYAKPASATPDVIYTGLGMGEFMGVLHFPKNDTDYRGQSIKAGYYTLRYALIPQDGNHMGVSNYRDFLLMIPIQDDTNPTQTMTFNEVVKESRLTAGTGHPAVLMLESVTQGSSATFPSAVQDDQGNWTVDVRLDASDAGQPQQLPLALVLVGQYQGEG